MLLTDPVQFGAGVAVLDENGDIGTRKRAGKLQVLVDDLDAAGSDVQTFLASVTAGDTIQLWQSSTVWGIYTVVSVSDPGTYLRYVVSVLSSVGTFTAVTTTFSKTDIGPTGVTGATGVTTNTSGSAATNRNLPPFMNVTWIIQATIGSGD